MSKNIILRNDGPNLHKFAYAKHMITLEMGSSKPQTLKTGVQTPFLFR